MGPIHPVWALAAIHPRWGNRYDILPNSLVKYLMEKGHGVSWKKEIPTAWDEHTWTGLGTPETLLVEVIKCTLLHGSLLLSPVDLMKSPNLEASAARAFDMLDDQRLIAVLHADDPVLQDLEIQKFGDLGTQKSRKLGSNK